MKKLLVIALATVLCSLKATTLQEALATPDAQVVCKSYMHIGVRVKKVDDQYNFSFTAGDNILAQTTSKAANDGDMCEVCNQIRDGSVAASSDFADLANLKFAGFQVEVKGDPIMLKMPNVLYSGSCL